MYSAQWQTPHQFIVDRTQDVDIQVPSVDTLGLATRALISDVRVAGSDVRISEIAVVVLGSGTRHVRNF